MEGVCIFIGIFTGCWGIAAELLFFSNKSQVYKSKTSEFADSKASILGDYIPSKLEFDEGENGVVDKNLTMCVLLENEKGRLLLPFWYTVVEHFKAHSFHKFVYVLRGGSSRYVLVEVIC